MNNLSVSEQDTLIKTLKGWQIKEEGLIFKKYDFPDFISALEFVNRVGNIAEDHNHHPDIKLSYGKVLIEVSTHSVGGLTEADFSLAKAIDALP